MASSTLYAPKVPAVQPAFVYPDDPFTTNREEGKVRIYFNLSSVNTRPQFKSVFYTLIDPNLSAESGLNSMLDMDKFPTGYAGIRADFSPPSEAGKNVVWMVNGSYYFDIILKNVLGKTLTQNQFYQMQIYLCSEALPLNADGEIEKITSAWLEEHKNNISIASTITLLRPVPRSTILVYLQKTNYQLNGVYGNIVVRDAEGNFNENYLEPISEYQIYIQEDTGTGYSDRIFETGWVYNTLGTQFEYHFKDLYLNAATYLITVQYKTLHGYQGANYASAVISQFAPQGAPKTDCLDYIPELGAIRIKNSAGTAIYRTSSKNNYLDLLEVNSNDYDIENGVIYKYYEKSGDSYIPIIGSGDGPIELEHVFLSDKNAQLAVMFNPNISNFKWVTQEGVTNTLGGKYPVFRRNGDTYYRQFNLSGTLAFDNDTAIQSELQDSRGVLPADAKWFFDFPYGILSVSESERDAIKAKYNTIYGTLKNNPDKWEAMLDQVYHDYVLKFLTNGGKKLFRSGPEGNMIVVLTNVSFTPNKSLGRRAYDFSATVTECDEYNYSNLEKAGLSGNQYYNTTEFDWGA